MTFQDYEARELCTRYPYQFIDNEWNQLPAGWWRLFGAVCALVDETLPSEKKLYLLNCGVFWTQCKEKFGGARFYCAALDDEVLDENVSQIIREAEQLSYTICEKCGDRGVLRNLAYWHITLCDRHYRIACTPP